MVRFLAQAFNIWTPCAKIVYGILDSTFVMITKRCVCTLTSALNLSLVCSDEHLTTLRRKPVLECSKVLRRKIGKADAMYTLPLFTDNNLNSMAHVETFRTTVNKRLREPFVSFACR